MRNVFDIGNKITTNRRNCLKVIDENDSQVVCQDLITNDFSVFNKTEHTFEIADIKVILTQSLIDIVNETTISEEDKQHILVNMKCCISGWL